MIQAASKLTERYQAIMPAAARVAPRLDEGNAIALDIGDNRVSIRKAQPADVAFLWSLERTLNEWESEADEEAWRDL